MPLLSRRYFYIIARKHKLMERSGHNSLELCFITFAIMYY